MENRKSITDFFALVERLSKNGFVEDKNLNLFKTICVYDYMHARCDWDGNCDKEDFARDLTNYVLREDYAGFVCDECDDTIKRDDCEHEKRDFCDQLEGIMKLCETCTNEDYDFRHPNGQGQYFIDCVRKLFEDREMNYGMFLDAIYTEYNGCVEDMCC
jgi:hypothetical protein